MPPRSWKRSREARLWRSLRPRQAARVLAGSHGERAGEEALLRAMLAERDRDPEGVWFWIGVFERLYLDHHCSA